mgnify:CR=1 FL=1
MRNLIHDLKQNHTVLISSHILTEISQTCDRLLVLGKGKLLGSGSEAELSTKEGDIRQITVTIRTPKVWEDRFDDYKRLTHHVTILVTGFKHAAGECQMGTVMVEQPKTASGWGPAKLSTSEKHWFEIDPDLPCQNLVKD